jgi:hypothetical protein
MFSAFGENDNPTSHDPTSLAQLVGQFAVQYGFVSNIIFSLLQYVS